MEDKDIYLPPARPEVEKKYDIQMATEQSDKMSNCEPCLTKSVSVVAVQYCQICDERYCEDCALSHKSQKPTKMHTLVEVQLTKLILLCEPCQYQNVKTNATTICQLCEELLCNVCKAYHLSQKQTKDHTMKSIPKEFLCEPCLNVGQRSSANLYCKDCSEPELLCSACATQHKAMKISRNHEISTDLAVFVLRFQNRDKFEEKGDSNNTNTLCGPCEYQTKRTDATHYCKTCDDRYCNNCLQQHKMIKSMANHVIVEIHEMVENTFCEPCSSLKKEIEAICYCLECKIRLCELCKKVHLSIKQSRNHKLSSLSIKVFCENCLELNKEEEAIFFCEECDGPICEACTDIHKTLKQTRDHHLSDDLSKCLLRSDLENPDCSKTGPNTREQTQVESSQKTALLEDAQFAAGGYLEPICDPCSYVDKEVRALFECSDCDESYCGECMQFHKSQTENRSHKVRKITKKNISCSSCLSLDLDVQATVFCVNCGEHKVFCDSCGRKHSSMKKTRGHVLSKHLDSIAHRNMDITPKQTIKGAEFIQPTKFVEHEKFGYLPGDLTPYQVDDIDKALNSGKEMTRENEKVIGKPYSTFSKSDSIQLQWETGCKLSDKETFQVMYKETYNEKWRTFVAEKSCKQCKITVTGLKSNTLYIFKVRILNEMSGDVGQSSAESDPIQTQQSPALRVLKENEKTSNGPPAIYRLPINENRAARNEKAKTRKFTLGQRSSDLLEKTIMIVGATGSGKSTLINGIANYLMGVNWEDSFRFTLVNLEKSEMKKKGNQAVSQTEWVTCYTIQKSLSYRVDFSVNLIDTPGFGDTRGMDHDVKIVSQIRELFTAKGEQGVVTLDAVCFILKAPDSRLTTTQKYIFDSILALFGNDIKDNICTLITFADGERPPVLAGIQALDGRPLPYKRYFTFNNSALFVDNTKTTSNNLSSFFWDMGTISCKRFFDHVASLKAKSLSLTSEVLLQREKLENTVVNLHHEIDLGFSNINILENEIAIFTRHRQAILENKDFEYEVNEINIETQDISGKGQHTTTCSDCNYTCHNNCAFANDDDKKKCIAMNSSGNCTECPKCCHWTTHKNLPYIIVYETRKAKKTYREMKKKYEEAKKKTLTQEQIVDEMKKDIQKIEKSIHIMLEVIAQINNRLKEIALRPDPLNTVEYIDLMIASEKREKKAGFEKRLDYLEQCKRKAKFGENAQILLDRFNKTISVHDIAVNLIADENKGDKGLLCSLKQMLRLG